MSYVSYGFGGIPGLEAGSIVDAPHTLLLEAISRPDVASKISGVVGLTAQISGESAKDFLMSQGIETVSTIAQAAASMLFATDVFKGAVQAVGAVADVIPLFGAIFGAGFDVFTADMAAAAQAKAQYVKDFRQYCVDEYNCSQVRKAGEVLHAVDIFVLNKFDRPCGTQTPGLNLYNPDLLGTVPREAMPIQAIAQCAAISGEPPPSNCLARTGVGKVLIAITETTDQMQDLAAVRATFKKPNLGIPQQTRDLFKRIRLSIESQYMQGEGGDLLWPLYIDLLRAEYDAGRITDQYCHYLYVLNEACSKGCNLPLARAYAFGAVTNRSGLISAFEADPVDAMAKLSVHYHPNEPLSIFQKQRTTHTCYLYQPQIVDTVIGPDGLLTTWRRKLNPAYASDKAAFKKLQVDLLNAARIVRTQRLHQAGTRGVASNQFFTDLMKQAKTKKFSGGTTSTSSKTGGSGSKIPKPKTKKPDYTPLLYAAGGLALVGGLTLALLPPRKK